jgi:hypothetical protein
MGRKKGGYISPLKKKNTALKTQVPLNISTKIAKHLPVWLREMVLAQYNLARCGGS